MSAAARVPMLVLQVLYLFAPLIVAAGLSALVLRLGLLRGLRVPIDAGRTFRGRRLFGDSKTWHGVAAAVVGCIATAAVQRYVVGERAGAVALVDYRTVDVALFGAAMGAGAIAGELPNSFVKRRLGIAPGAPAPGRLAVLFYVWDQVDLLTTAWPAVAFWVRPTVPLVATSLVLAMLLHPAISVIGFALGVRASAR